MALTPRCSTANRILSVAKAILNKAFHDGLVSDNLEWRKVLPFKNADEARIRFLSDAEGIRLVNACPADLRALVRGALLTGARFGELAELRVQDVDLRAGRIYVAPAKSGRSRHVPLNPEGVALFRELLTGKTGDALVFVRADGKAWGKNYHVRPLREACKVAKIHPAVAFHELRHTYASHLAQAGVDLLTISKLLGHADTRITSKHYAHLADKTLAAAVIKLPSFNAQSRRLQRLLIGHATECDLDAAGRILLSPPLREFASLDKAVVLIGQGNKFEIWDESIWNTRRAEWLEKGGDEGPMPEGLEQLSL